MHIDESVHIVKCAYRTGVRRKLMQEGEEFVFYALLFC